MSMRAMEGTCLATLVRMAMPSARVAERECPRTRGRPPEYQDWQMMILVLIAVLVKRKSKSAQYRYLFSHRRELVRLLGMRGFPSRTTYFDRYRTLWTLLEHAIRCQGTLLIRQGIVDATVVAVDKSVIRAKGPQWHHRDRRRGVIPKGLTGVDREATWTFSEHHGWVQGYAYEVVVSAPKHGVVVPLLASADTACVSEHVSFGPKIEHLPPQTRYAITDRGYDNGRFDDAMADSGGTPGPRCRLVCQQNRRAGCGLRSPEDMTLRQLRRHRRIAFAETKRGRGLLRRRGMTVEPFNDWFKQLFELDDRVWHRGLGNNRTQLLTALFAYQLLVRYNHRRGHQNGQVKWIVDTL